MHTGLVLLIIGVVIAGIAFAVMLKAMSDRPTGSLFSRENREREDKKWNTHLKAMALMALGGLIAAIGTFIGGYDLILTIINKIH